MTHLPSHPEPMIFRAFARAHPAPLDALAPFTEALLYGDGPLSFGERETIAAWIGALKGCDYVRDSHRSAALAHGMDAAATDRLLSQRDAGAIGDARLAAALAFVARLVEAPASCDGALVTATMAVGHDEAAIRQLVYLAGYWTMIVCMVEGLGLEGDEAYHAAMGPQLAREAHAIRERLRRAGES